MNRNNQLNYSKSILVQQPNGETYNLGVPQLQKIVEPFGLKLERRMALSVINFLTSYDDIRQKFVRLLNDPQRVFTFLIIILGFISGGRQMATLSLLRSFV